METDFSREKRILGVIGNPVSHSLSPLFQNYLIKKYKLNWSYLPFCVSKEHFDLFINGIRHLENITGFNVTVPFKEMIMPHCNKISFEAEKVGAVNTVTVKDGLLYGDNTDVYGIKMTLERYLSVFRLDDRPVLLVGAGGVAKAALFVLELMGAKKVIIVNRSVDRARALEKYVKENYSYQVSLFGLTRLNSIMAKKDIHLIINTTTVGLKGESLPLDYDILLKECKIFDMVYSKTKTPLVINAIKKGIRAVDGLHMLVYQGVKSFSIWTGIENVDADKVFEYLKKKIKK